MSILTDRWYYGMWTFPPLNFLYFNLSQNLAVFYGHNRWDYYLTEGLPLLLTTFTPFAATAVFKAIFGSLENVKRANMDSKVRLNAFRSLALTITFSITLLSLISHKEVRFVYPLLPALHVLTAAQVASFVRPLTKPKWCAVLVLILLNILIAFYASQIHQCGAIDIIDYLRHQQELRLERDPSSRTSVGFFMPCHSTPWRSHLVYPGIDAWALTCEPPLDFPPDQRSSYLDEADQFYLKPEAWLEANMRKSEVTSWDIKEKREWPEYVVFFQQLEPVIQKMLQNTTYNECWRGFNSHWHDDWRRHGDVVAWCRT
jgi:phosphatidylinositol glycan class B